MSGRSPTLWICSPRFDLPRSFRQLTPAFSDGISNQIRKSTMNETVKRKTMIVTGASQGIGAGVTKAFIKRGYNVVANSRKITESELAVKQMLAQKTGGSVTGITSAMVEHPITGVNCSVPMITKGGLEAITRSLALEYAQDGIRFNVVAPGIVDTPMHASDPHEFLKSLSPMGMISDVDDIVEAIVYLTEARHVTGEVLHVDAGAHNGKW